MRLGSLLAVGTLALFAFACGDGSGQTGPSLRRPSEASNDKTGSTTDEQTADETPGGDGTDLPANDSPLPEPDADMDGVPDAKDCAPQDATIAGTKLVDEMLTADRQTFAVAPGFPASWTYGTAYMQNRLIDAGDMTLYTGDANLENVDIEVRAASTDVGAITPRLRQLMIVVGASSVDGTTTAYGCGLEVVQGLAPEQRTSVVKLSGPPTAITTPPIERTARGAVQEGEDFIIRARVKTGTITCTAQQGLGTVTTATATVPDLKGAVGFYTRQTKAAFKSVKVCKLQ